MKTLKYKTKVKEMLNKAFEERDAPKYKEIYSKYAMFLTKEELETAKNYYNNLI